MTARMTAIKMTMPKFRETQRVFFFGGEGTVQGCKLEAGTWTYLVEMSQGPEPDFGRIGAETKIFLPETDLKGFKENAFDLNTLTFARS